MTILILYSTTDGHTKTICHYIGQYFTRHGYDVNVADLSSPPELAAPQAVLIGAGVRYGHHRPEVLAFLRNRRDWLRTRHSGVFSVNLTARKPGRDQAERNPYLRRLLAQIGWRPDVAAAFAGKLDYPRYRWLDRQLIRGIMALTGGPTDPTTVQVFTDWQAVDAFALSLMRRLRQP
jgi:menaquinone-dependent protoporphyrinogen oxidase